MKFVSRIFAVLLVLLLAASAVTAAYAADIDLGVVINKDLESEGTITVTVDNSESTNAVLQNSPAKLEIPCTYDHAKVLYGTQTVAGAVLDTVNDKITFPVAKGGTYTIQKQAAYTVTFHTNCDSTVVSQVVVQGGKVEEPSKPSNYGYSLFGWYTESTFENLWNFKKDTVTDDIDLYAKWVGVSVDVTSNAATKADWNPTADNSALLAIANAQSKANESVSVELSFSEINPASASADVKEEIGEIVDVALGRELEYLDISLLCSVDGKAASDIGDENNTLVKITLDFDFDNKTNVAVFRYHEDGVDVLTHSTNTTAERLELTTANKNSDKLVIYAKKFSTYAIGYLEGSDKLDNYTFKATSYSWSKNSNRTLTIKIADEGQAYLMDSIIINGSTVDPDNYTVSVENGTINITLKASYLQNLPIKNGYGVSVKFRNGGVATTKLNILKSSGNASTGDMFRMGLWATLLIGSAAGVAALLIFKKRKK